MPCIIIIQWCTNNRKPSFWWKLTQRFVLQLPLLKPQASFLLEMRALAITTTTILWFGVLLPTGNINFLCVMLSLIQKRGLYSSESTFLYCRAVYIIVLLKSVLWVASTALTNIPPTGAGCKMCPERVCQMRTEKRGDVFFTAGIYLT